MDELLELIEAYNDYIKKVPSGSKYIANTLRTGNVALATMDIRDFSEGMLWLADASELLKGKKVAYTLDLSKIEVFLGEINTGLELQDYKLVAEKFENEIAQFFERIVLVEGLVQ